MLLALALTSGIFASTYLTDSTTLAITRAGGDFALVTPSVSGKPTWKAFGFYRGSTGGGDLFTINCTGVDYSGDLAATVYFSNADALSNVYRVLALKIEVYDSGSVKMDINADNVSDEKDFALLTLRTGAVDLFINQDTADWYTVEVASGYYATHIWGMWAMGSEDPQVLLNVSQW